MTAFQVQTFVPRDGNLSITLPERFREADVELLVSKKEKHRKMSKEERLAWINSFRGTLSDIDYSDIREESEKSRKMNHEEHIAWMEKFRGSLCDIDYSDIREETDREI